MKIDSTITPDGDVTRIVAAAATAESDGYAGAWTAEAGRDPFLPLALAAEHTTSIELGTNIAVAFARNPMSLAAVASDLNSYSQGRFLLGLGSQVRAHIEKRYSMVWSSPAARMREMVEAMRAIWRTWNEGAKLDFRGDFYSHTLMTPFFNPGPNPWGAPKVFIAAVGPRMTAVAGEVGDGLLLHPFTTERYLRDATLPVFEAGLAQSKRNRSDVEVALPVMVVTGASEEELTTAARTIKRQIAFYASTPAYRPVLDAHGWGDLQPELNTRSKQGDWRGMTEMVDDDMLRTFAVVAEPGAVAEAIVKRYGDVADRINLYTTYALDSGVRTQVINGLREQTASR
jgi:probable F420-dependent oxidoreductase